MIFFSIILKKCFIYCSRKVQSLRIDENKSPKSHFMSFPLLIPKIRTQHALLANMSDESDKEMFTEVNTYIIDSISIDSIFEKI